MAPILKSSAQLASDVRELINRMEDDDLIVWPDMYYSALSKAHRYYRSKIAQHSPGILMETKVIASTDDGESYDLADHHHGDLEIWLPPGPPSGVRMQPALPESAYEGFYLEGTSVYLTLPRVYSPGIYARAVYATVADIADDQTHSLPAYTEDMLVARAAYYLALTPGFLGDANVYKRMALDEWQGDAEDSSDMGVLGTIKRLAANEGVQAADEGYQPWYARIPPTR